MVKTKEALVIARDGLGIDELLTLNPAVLLSHQSDVEEVEVQSGRKAFNSPHLPFEAPHYPQLWRKRLGLLQHLSAERASAIRSTTALQDRRMSAT